MTVKRLEQRLRQLNVEEGPVVVLSKGHSGSRFLADLLEAGGVFMGADHNSASDSLAWHEDFAVPLITSEHWPDFAPNDELRALADGLLEPTLERYLGGEYAGGPWGWKGSPLFVMPLIETYFPAIRCLHLIRDGRDVATSEDGLLNLPFHFPLRRRNPLRMAKRVWEGITDRRRRDAYRLRVFFGTSDLAQWQDVPLDRQGVLDNRYLLQMQSWIRNVTAARAYGASLGDRYLEVRYEELVTAPATVAERVTGWLGLDGAERAVEFARSRARTGSLRKWERASWAPDRQRDFDRAVEHGRPLLEELGYLT